MNRGRGCSSAGWEALKETKDEFALMSKQGFGIRVTGGVEGISPGNEHFVGKS